MPTWTEDSHHILYREYDHVFIVPADGSSDPQRYTETDPFVPEPAWPADYDPPYNSQLSPDEQYLAIVKGGEAFPAERGLYLRPIYPLIDVSETATRPEARANSQTYTDPMLNFSLSYPPSWKLAAYYGTNRNDRSGRTILLERETYLLKIEAQFRPERPGECSGSFHQDVDTLAQTILLESERPTFHRITWQMPDQLRLTDENEQIWIYRLDDQRLEPAVRN